LTVITGYTELLLNEYGQTDDDPNYIALDQIRKASDRAASLTRQLLAFSRKQVLQPRVLQLNETITEIDKILKRLIGEDIKLTTLLAADTGWVKVDAGQIEQIIINLAVNARDAMPHGGKLTIETQNIYLDETYAQQHAEVRAGPYIMLAVSDTGTGIDAETQAKIFEPFFTTKEQDRGTGLGLATVYGIVKQSGGHIWVYSEVGVGTTFKIYLPQVEPPAIQAPQNDIHTPVKLGSETILLVEDEEIVRKLAHQILLNNGYKVLAVNDGQEAIQVCKERDMAVDLLLTDVVIPGGISGQQLVKLLTLFQPELKVLYMSGYPNHAIVQHEVLAEDNKFLQKPFTPADLAHKVREVLDA
jgi:CheY-like chemotaxis protein